LIKLRILQEVLSYSFGSHLTLIDCPGSNFFIVGEDCLKLIADAVRVHGRYYSIAHNVDRKGVSATKCRRYSFGHDLGGTLGWLVPLIVLPDFRNLFVWLCSLGFLLFRVLKRGRDARFDDIRSHFFPFLGNAFCVPAVTLLTQYSWQVFGFVS
jgi:hypothetical protein